MVTHCLRAIALVALLAAGTAAADDAPAKITYDDHVRPVLREHCFTCHNQSNAKSDLALDSYAGLMKGGASGEVVLSGDPDSSRLWALVSHQEEPKMPPQQDKLAQPKLDAIKAWIEGGCLENAGSTARKSNKPKVNLKVSGGSSRPEGPVAMPEGLSRQPLHYSPKTRAVTALAASPWAPVVAVAGHKQIVLYHSDSAECLGILPFPEGVPHVLKFSRSGSLLLAGGGRGGQSGKVVVFDVRTGERVFEVGDELDVVLAADINEDHTRIALSGPGKIIRIFDTADGSQLHEIKKHTEWVYSLEFSPDGVLLATADRNGDVFVWEAETAREYQSLKGHAGAVQEVSWRDDSNLLATTGDDGTIRLWEMENGQQVKNWGAHAGGSLAVRFTHDGRLVSAGRDRVVRVWNADGAQAQAFEALPDVALKATLTHDGARAVGGDWTGQIRMWDVADAKQVAALAMNPPTLEMLAQSAMATAAQLQSEAEQAASQLAAAEQALAAKTAAAQTAAQQLAAAQAALQAAEAERTAADQQKAQAAAKAAMALEAAQAAKARAQAAQDAAAQQTPASGDTAQSAQ